LYENLPGEASCAAALSFIRNAPREGFAYTMPCGERSTKARFISSRPTRGRRRASSIFRPKIYGTEETSDALGSIVLEVKQHALFLSTPTAGG
jgi:hypothetical protein